MLTWLWPCYLDEAIVEPEKTRRRLDLGKPVPGIYLVTLSETPGNMLELLPSVRLNKKFIREHCPPVVGMAYGKDHAIRLATDIIEETYLARGDYQAGEYLRSLF